MKKRKLRCLTAKTKTSKLKKFKKIAVFVTLGLVSVILSIYYSPAILEDFLIHYNLHYNLIVHGNSNYCNANLLNTETVFREIQKDIINQDEVIYELQNLFKNNTKFLNSIAMIGSSGVGKTLLATKLAANFPWSDNVDYFKWSIYEDDKIKIRKLLRYIKRLNNCGLNLLIIDDLSLNNLKIIDNFNENVLKKLSLTNINRLIILYIFNLSRFTTLNDKNYDNNLINFKYDIGNNIKTVVFKNFNRTHLDDCIENEIKHLNINLNEEKLIEIRNSIDVHRSGCKNVYAKVKMFMLK